MYEPLISAHAGVRRQDICVKGQFTLIRAVRVTGFWTHTKALK